jgi:hypothetical protein
VAPCVAKTWQQSRQRPSGTIVHNHVYAVMLAGLSASSRLPTARGSRSRHLTIGRWPLLYALVRFPTGFRKARAPGGSAQPGAGRMTVLSTTSTVC